MAANNCTIPGCEEDVKYHHLQVCSACYSGLSNWRGRNKRDKEHRLYLNKRLATRMEFILDHPKHAPRYQRDIHKGRKR